MTDELDKQIYAELRNLAHNVASREFDVLRVVVDDAHAHITELIAKECNKAVIAELQDIVDEDDQLHWITKRAMKNGIKDRLSELSNKENK